MFHIIVCVLWCVDEGRNKMERRFLVLCCVLYVMLAPSNINEQPIGARNNVLIRGNPVLYGAINAF